MAQKQAKGFTIIEVVLVLAIGGLILLMALIAWPAMQRGQRDDARKRDATLVVDAMTSYSSNNRGAMADDTKLKNYLEGDELSGNIELGNIKVEEYSGATTTITLGSGDKAVGQASLRVVTKAKCGESGKDGQTVTKGTSREFVVIIQLEQGGGQYYCVKG